MKYYADYSTNNDTTWNSKPFEYTNKRNAIRSIRKIAIGNTFIGNCAYVIVTDSNCRIVYKSIIHC